MIRRLLEKNCEPRFLRTNIENDLHKAKGEKV